MQQLAGLAAGLGGAAGARRGGWHEGGRLPPPCTRGARQRPVAMSIRPHHARSPHLTHKAASSSRQAAAGRRRGAAMGAQVERRQAGEAAGGREVRGAEERARGDRESIEVVVWMRGMQEGAGEHALKERACRRVPARCPPSCGQLSLPSNRHAPATDMRPDLGAGGADSGSAGHPRHAWTRPQRPEPPRVDLGVARQPRTPVQLQGHPDPGDAKAGHAAAAACSQLFNKLPPRLALAQSLGIAARVATLHRSTSHVQLALQTL